MDEAKLADWLSGAAGAAVEIVGRRRLSGGAIQQNWRLDVRRGGVAEAWVLRTDAAATLAVSRSRRSWIHSGLRPCPRVARSMTACLARLILRTKQ